MHRCPMIEPIANNLQSSAATAGQPPLAAVCDVLSATEQDLEKLDTLLNHHCSGLIAVFEGAVRELHEATASGALSIAQVEATEDVMQRVQSLLGQAVLNLQYQDIASQMIGHCRTRLQSCVASMEHVPVSQYSDPQTLLHTLGTRSEGPVARVNREAGEIELFDENFSAIEGESS